MTDMPEEQQTSELDQQRQEIIKKFEYIYNWISGAPDFASMMQVIAIKIMADRKVEGTLDVDDVPTEEVQLIGKWLERIFDDISALTGILDGHITVTFTDAHTNPIVGMTPQGEKWLQEMQQKMETQQGAE